MKGKIINQTKTEIHLQVDNQTRIFPKADIQEVDYADAPQPVKPAAPVKVVEKEKPALTPPEAAKRPLNQYDLVWRSAVLPGWGQYKVEQKKWAILEGTTTFLALGYTLGERNKALAAKKSYENSIGQSFAMIQGTVQPGANPADALVKQFVLGLGPYNAFQSQVAKYNTSLQILGLVYFGQLVHSWFMGKKNVKSPSPVLTYEFMIVPVQLATDQKENHALFGFRFIF